jgi:VCBS repeat-containing protein
VLADDSDPDGDNLTAAIVSSTPNGSLSLASDGSFSYTPNAGFTGSDTFTYQASDGSLSDSATVTITIGGP